MRVGAILFAALLILGCAAWARPPEYDEAYSIFLTAGDPRPAWPAGEFRPAEIRHFYTGQASPREIAAALRKGDVHPPLYFWLLEYWRRLTGPSWFAARLLSVGLTLAALAGICWLASLTEISPSAAMLIALLSYGFAYTGIVARGFALAQALNILGIALVLSAARSVKRSTSLALAAGLAFGAAAFANYLAVFVGLAALLWAAMGRQRSKILVPAAAGFAIFLPALLFFFHAQQHSRIGQFQPFSLTAAIALLARDFGATIFGGLPVYAGRAGGAVTAALAILMLICAGFILKNWQAKLALLALCVLAMPAGLLSLGIVFNNTPIEIRYLAFATPWLALLLAATLPPALRTLLLAVQGCGVVGLLFAASTMQPQGLAARQLSRLGQPTGLVLLPFGNDGVGIPGPFIAAAPDNLRIELVGPGEMPDLAEQQSFVLASIGADNSSKTTSSDLLAKLKADPCWKLYSSTDLLKSFVRTCKNS